jgi:hypothetical protein
VIITSSLWFLAWLLPPLSCLTTTAVGVAQRLVDLSANPQTVQQHRDLPGHGHHRPLL